MKRVDELWTGDQVFTPAGRWETVTNLDAPRHSYLVRLYTDRTGPGYAWVLPGSQELPTVDRVSVAVTPTVRIFDDRHRVIAYIGSREYGWGYRDVLILADASPQGRGQGWEVRDRPNGGEVAATAAASKAAALSAVKRAAKTHAKALGLRMHRPEAREENKQ